MVVKDKVLVVEKFVESVGGVDGFGEDLFERFRVCDKSVVHANVRNIFTRRIFEISLVRVCRSHNGVVCFDSEFDRSIKRRHFVVSFVK